MCCISKIFEEHEPSSYNDAIKDPCWKQAMENKTWDLVPLPSHRWPIGCKWVYKIKYKVDDSIERYKARLVAKGFTQREGFHYQETFSPVAKEVTVRSFLSIATIRNWHLHQMDVHNAFLHGDLVEEIYMDLPPGLCSQGENRVCHLHKSLYRLKHASCQLYAKFTTAITAAKFKQSKHDYTLFTWKRGTSSIYLLIYVDEILIIGNYEPAVTEFKNYPHSTFRIKDLGPLNIFLG